VQYSELQVSLKLEHAYKAVLFLVAY